MHLEFTRVPRLSLDYLGDLNDLWQVVSGGHGMPITEADMVEMFKSDSSSYLFICKDKTSGRLVGQVWVTIIKTSSEKKAFIDELVVLKEYEGHGIGGHLMAMAEDYAWREGVKKMELTSGHHRGPAIQFYKNRGYDIRETNVMNKVLTEKPIDD